MEAIDLVVEARVGHRQGGFLSEPTGEITFLTGEGTPAVAFRGDKLAEQAAPVHQRHQHQVSVDGIEQLSGKGSTRHVVGSVPDDGVAADGRVPPCDEVLR